MTFTHIQVLLVQLGGIAIAIGGLLMIVLGTTGFGKTWCKRMFLLGLLCVAAAHFVTPQWLP